MRDWAHSRRLGTPADEAGYVVLRQPPASKLANLFRIDVRDHALGLVTQQLGRRVTEHPPGGWLGPRTPSLREGPGSASVPSGSPDPVAGTGARRRGPAVVASWRSSVYCKDLRSGGCKYSVNPPASVQRVPCPRPRPRLAVGSVLGIPRRNLTMRRGYDVSGAGTSSSHPHARLCSGLRFHGRNRSTSSTARPPAWAHASR